MARQTGVEMAVCFKIDEEVLPLQTKSMGDIIPEPLDPRVVYTSVTQ